MQEVHDERILILAKTYPSLSEKYLETVCTAGIRADGSWVRIYPIKFRQMNEVQRYRKYQWISCKVYKPECKNDPRPESFHIEGDITIEGDPLSTRNSWAERRDAIIHHAKVYTNKRELIEAAKDFSSSLALFKPSRLEGPTVEEDEREWNPERLKRALHNASQLDLFEEARSQFTIVKKLPYKFHYKVYDDEGAVSNHIILDWELGSLFWGELRRLGSEKAAIDSVIAKFSEFCDLKQHDTYLYMGTSKEFQQKKAANPWMIIGVGYFPKIKEEQLMLGL